MLTHRDAQYLVLPAGAEDARSMPTLVAGSRLKEAIAAQSFILDGDPLSVEAVKYDFHMGSRVLKWEYGQPIEVTSIPQEKRWIYPGEVAFVLTSERLNLPRNMIASLIPKRKLAHGGIIILGGLSVDPEYKGVLVIGMYNLSSTPFPLRPGKKLIAAVFYELGDTELDDHPAAPPKEIKDFPDELIDLISKYRPVELSGLQEQLASTRLELHALKADLQSDKTWKDDFKRGLDELRQGLAESSRQLLEIGKNLEREATTRAGEDSAINKRLTGMSNMFFGLKLGWGAFLGLLLIVVGAVIGGYIQQRFFSSTPPPPAIAQPAIPPAATTGTPTP